ncbi:MAG: acryloyl-CoA reductase, partial [Pseudomonadota bacterium]
QIVADFQTVTLDDLSDGEVVIRAEYSGINYKDALAATGAGKILRRYPLTGGIDVAGRVVTSSSSAFKPGAPVLVTGCGLSETRDGGYSEFVRVPASAVIELPDTMTMWDAMCLGTAGFTAALAVTRMEDNGLESGAGPVVVTGATGGVGSVAVDLLAGRGYSVTAVTGKAEAWDYLRTLGATDILLRDDIDYGNRPLEKSSWAGAVDNVGGVTLTWLTRTTNYGGSIASVGLAGGHVLNTTVMPFILRGVNLLGINSVDTPHALRQRVWKRLATDLAPRTLDTIGAKTIPFHALPDHFTQYLRGGIVGRTIVRIADDA